MAVATKTLEEEVKVFGGGGEENARTPPRRKNRGATADAAKKALVMILRNLSMPPPTAVDGYDVGVGETSCQESFTLRFTRLQSSHRGGQKD